MRPPSVMRRERSESERCCGVHHASVQQHKLRAYFALLTRSRRADVDYSTSERDTKRARRANADHATSEREAKRAPAHVAVNYVATPQRGLCELRTRSKESTCTCCGALCRDAPARTMRPPKAIRREHGAPTRTMQSPNAMRRERGAPTRTNNALTQSF
jgi:hypothetical protein